ncbi:hypothetical protein V5799_004009 [Amblyomma americanum]|uniref:Uncharacterized protein n=1 Tax=Amblyomma americanum TaxID=6943 RepID=A0AAQ4D7C0_AMBAM
MPGIPRPCSPRRKTRSASVEPQSGARLAPGSPTARTTTGPVLVYQVEKPVRSEPSREPVLVYQVAQPARGTPSHEPVLVYQYPASPSPTQSVRRAATSNKSSGRASSASPRGPSPEAEEPEPQSCCIMDRIQKKYQESSSQLDGQHLYIVLCFQSAVATLLFLLFLCVPVAMITVGALNLSNCRLSYGIPLCLTVAGCAYLLIPLLSAALDWNASNSYCPIMISVLVMVAMGASVAGSVIVFTGMWPSGKPDDPRYCHPAVYYFSFVMWSTFVIFIPVMLVVSVVVFRKYGSHNVHAATMPPSRQ